MSVSYYKAAQKVLTTSGEVITVDLYRNRFTKAFGYYRGDFFVRVSWMRDNRV